MLAGGGEEGGEGLTPKPAAGSMVFAFNCASEALEAVHLLSHTHTLSLSHTHTLSLSHTHSISFTPRPKP